MISTLSTLLILFAALSLLISLGFIFFAWKNSDWSKPSSMLAEFSAVLLAIVIGVWVSSLERSAERRETAEVLITTSISSLAQIISVLSQDIGVLFTPTVSKPNIFETFISDASAARAFEEDFLTISQHYRIFLVSDRAAAECDINENHFMMHPELLKAARKLVPLRHDDAPDDVFPLVQWWHIATLDHPMPSAQREDGFWDPVWVCLWSNLAERTFAALDLYEALCLAALRAGMEPNCRWDLVTNDFEERERWENDPNSHSLPIDFDFSSRLRDVAYSTDNMELLFSVGIATDMMPNLLK